MPWRERSLADEREAFVVLASEPGANVSALCRRFGVSRSNGNKWLKRYRAGGAAALAEGSRRPKASPGRTAAAVEAAILEVRAGSNEAWGGRKIAVVLKRKGVACPSASTITEILRRHGRLEARAGEHPWGGLMRLGVKVSHGRPYHPQTQGKEERFHRTLKAEVLAGRSFADLAQCQRAFDAWRRIYNHERPHQALGMGVPADRYQPSQRPFPETLAPIVYGQGDLVRQVSPNGFIGFKARRWRVGKPFKGLPVALRPSPEDGLFDLRFADHLLGRINLRTGQKEPCGFVDDEAASPTTPQAQPQQKI